MDQLTSSLLDLVHELEGRGIPITIGGGFGLYLKRQHLETTGQQTLFAELPEPRSTNDLDIFLYAEVIADLERTRAVAEAIRRLGYTVVEKAKFLQWKRESVVAGVPQELKIDILVGPLGDFRKKLHVKMPRVRPKEDIDFHAHAVEEAICIEDGPLAVTVRGKRSSGEPYAGTIYIPQAFPYLMMKLHAFEDRKNKGETDKERLHAFDVYAIVGMMTEAEYGRAKQLGAAHMGNEHVNRARAIIRNHFAAKTGVGVLRVREHPLFRDAFPMDDFISILGEIFPSGKHKEPLVNENV